jgi:hypothetical protein
MNIHLEVANIPARICNIFIYQIDKKIIISTICQHNDFLMVHLLVLVHTFSQLLTSKLQHNIYLLCLIAIEQIIYNLFSIKFND